MSVENILLKDILNNNTLYEVEEINGKLEFVLDGDGNKIEICEIDELDFDIQTIEKDKYAIFNAGISPKSIYYNEENNGYEFHQGKTYYGDTYLGDSPIYTNKLTTKSIKNDIIISMRAPAGTLNINRKYNEICLGRGLGAIRVSEDNYYKYIFYGYKSLNLNGNMGMGFTSINKADIETKKIKIPKSIQKNKIHYSSLKLQKSIAKNIENKLNDIDRRYSILDTIDILNNSLIETMIREILNNTLDDTIEIKNNYLHISQIKWKEDNSFNDIFKVITPPLKIKDTEMLELGKHPVVSQSNGLINGYTNENDGIVFINEKPIIIFGDHTTIIKYIDFNFYAGADGTKILQPLPIIYSKFAYYLALFRIKSTGYQRHFSIFKEIIFKIPDISIIDKNKYSSYDLQIAISKYMDNKIFEIEKKNINTNQMRKVLEYAKGTVWIS